MEKRFGFTVITGFFLFQKRLLCFRDLHRNIDFVFDLLLSLIFDLLYILHFLQINNAFFLNLDRNQYQICEFDWNQYGMLRDVGFCSVAI